MSIRDRVGKLEGRVGATARMSSQEVETHAAEFVRKLRAAGADDTIVVAELAAWRAMVAGARGPRIQRAVAGFAPADLHL